MEFYREASLHAYLLERKDAIIEILKEFFEDDVTIEFYADELELPSRWGYGKKGLIWLLLQILAL